jgi:hypothetical protein
MGSQMSRRESVEVFADALMSEEATLDEFTMWMIRSEGSVESVDWVYLYDTLSRAFGGTGDLIDDMVKFLWGPDSTIVVYGGAGELAEHLLRGHQAIGITPTEWPDAAAPWSAGRIAIIREPTELPLQQAFLSYIEPQFPGDALLDNFINTEWTLTHFALETPGRFFEVETVAGVMLVDQALDIATELVERDSREYQGAILEITSVLQEGAYEIELDSPIRVRVAGLVADSLEAFNDGVIRPIWGIVPVEEDPEIEYLGPEAYYIRGLTRSVTGEVGNPDFWRVVQMPVRAEENPDEGMCPIRDMLYGGMPGAGGYESNTMVEVGAQQIAEAAHCILGSLGKLEHPSRKDWDWRWSIPYEKDHLGEEIDIIRKWVFEHERYGWHPTDVERLHRPEASGYEEYVDRSIESVQANSSRLAERAREMKRLTTENCRGLPQPIGRVASYAYDVIIALAEAMERSFAFAPESFYNPFTNSDLRLSTNMLYLEIENLIKLERRAQ